MLIVRETELFSSWLKGLRDSDARAQILRRVSRMRAGNFGDVASVGQGVSELRIDHGPGYRVYYARRGNAVYMLLCGGNKKSQAGDIVLAKRLWAELKRSA